ncbi:MAG: putative ABC transporter permease [Oscillospiraceae bacterium]
MEQTIFSSDKSLDISKAKNSSFAKGLNFYKLFWVFFMGCFAGVIIETGWCLLTLHHFESRSGLVYGPFNLVYGFGALIITVGLYWMAKKRDIFIILGGVVLGSLFEYVCSWIQEFLFGTVSWEYGMLSFNVNGRISLLYSIFWGILALFWIKGIFPLMSRLIEKIPNKVGKPLTWVLLAFMIFNTVVSGVAVGRMAQRRENIPAKSAITKIFDEHFPDERLQKIYPNMVVVEKSK